MQTDAAAERRARRTEASVRRFMEANGLWPDEGGLLVAVSGGPDSTALLAILSRLASKRKQRLVAAYFDHRLRGAAASAEERGAVEALTDSLGVELITGDGDVKRRGRGIEEAARRERYEFLARAAVKSGCSAVATGHTASDQAETVLLHLLRGSGLAGLSGMAAKSLWPWHGHEGLSLVRPLLPLSKDDTARYCADRGLSPVQDESNLSPDYLRNRLRHELLPALRGYNPRIDAALLRLAEAARLEHDFVAGAARAALPEGATELSRKQLASLHPAPRREALRLVLRAVSDDSEDYESDHVVALERLVLQGRTGDRIDLPDGVSAHLSRDALAITLASAPKPVLPEAPATLPVPGATSFGWLEIAAGGEGCGTSADLDAEAVGAEVTVRRWRPGDRIKPLGLQGSKKLQDLFVDEHVVREERNRIPVFENQRGILWVGGLRVANWAAPRPDHPVVTLSYRSHET